MAERFVKVTVKNLKCFDTAALIGQDDVYFISTLKCTENPRNISTIPAKPIKEPLLVSDVIENVDDDGKPWDFRKAAFDSACPTEIGQEGDKPVKTAITGSIYFMNRKGKQDIRRKPKNPIPANRAAFAGAVLGIMTGFPISIALGFFAGLGLFLGISGLFYFGAMGINFILTFDTQDEFLFAVTPTIPVEGSVGAEPVPGSPFSRSDNTDDIDLIYQKRTIEFDGLSTSVKYEVSLEVQRWAIK